MIDFKDIIGIVAVVITLLSYTFYLTAIFNKTIKPHAFSWLIWSILISVAFLGQLHDNAGAGAWATGLSAFLCSIIALVSLFRGEKDITRSDWICFITALCTIPIWHITQTPIYSILLVIIIDGAGYFPTIRKSYNKPHEETAVTYFLCGLKYFTALFALNNYTLLTMLYPMFSVLAEFTIVIFLLWRRHVIKTLTI